MLGVMLFGFAETPAPGQCRPAELATIIATDAATSDGLARSVAMHDDTAIVGAPMDTHLAGSAAGAAYIFVRSGEMWIQQAKLIAADAAPNERFGVSVALWGDTAVVGAFLADHNGGVDAGSSYVFVRSGPPGSKVWTQQAKLTASDAEKSDFFGIAVAVSGDTAVVGSYQDDLEGGVDAGSAYVFVRSGPPGSEVWTEQAKLVADDAAQLDLFGFAVAISDNTAVIGSYLDDNRGGTNAGSAYVYVRSRGVWSQQAKLITVDAADADWIGISVAIDGDTAVVGANLDDYAGQINTGSASVFVRSGAPGSEVWTEQAKLTVPDAAIDDQLGLSVAISGGTAVIGALYDDHAGGFNAGSASVFARSGPSGGERWTLQATLTASDAAPSDTFGNSVAISDGRALIGAYLDDHEAGTDAGSAYIFSLDGCGQPSCSGDLDASGAVNGIDLAMLLGQWTGSASYTPCPPSIAPDLNGDCKVNGLDLALLLGEWGACE
jgi:hypothetical protein